MNILNATFFSISDRVINSFDERFADLHDLVKDFTCLLPTHFDDTCNWDRIEHLAEFYAGDIKNDALFDDIQRSKNSTKKYVRIKPSRAQRSSRS